jgi:hypothetical protein
MTWIQLFKSSSFEAALKKRRKNYFHVDPILKGKQLKFVKNLFNMTKLPFVWDDKEIVKENNPLSPYHKLPKSLVKKEKERYERILKLRQGIASAKEKELKYRQESINKRSFKGINEIIKKTMPFMIKQTQVRLEGEYRASKGRKLVAEHIKEIPRVKNVDFGRRGQEKVKNLLEDNIMSVNSINENLKQIQKNKQESKQKEEDKKKAEAKLDKNIKTNESSQATSYKSASGPVAQKNKEVKGKPEKTQNKTKAASSGSESE